MASNNQKKPEFSARSADPNVMTSTDFSFVRKHWYVGIKVLALYAIFAILTSSFSVPLWVNWTVSIILLILWVSAIVSSFLDNIPFVATLIPLILTMQSSGVDVTPLWWAVSLGACLGGNGTLIGASANVVLSGISNRHGFPITFASYFKVGFPLMLVSVAISTVFLLLRFT